MKIYSLLDIKYNSWKLLIILIPPIYSLWLLAIGKRLSEKLKKSDRIFTLITILFFGLNTALIILWPFYDLSILRDFKSEITILFKIYFFLYLIIISILTNITIKYERLKLSERFYSIINFGDYIKRFFTFIYYPFFIWTYQKIVNNYNEDIIKTRH